MSDTVYDANVELYLEFIDRALAERPSLFLEMLTVFDDMLADRIAGAVVCDVACGEGYLSRHLAGRGAREVVGVDLSRELIDAARNRTQEANVSYRVEDAQRLGSFSDASVDVAVSQMALMDVADHRALFASVRRVLKPRGVWVFSLLHPCFESPYVPPDEQPFLVDGDGMRTACVVRRYASEGHWHGAGIRGPMGSYHRMLSTYLNDLTAAGLRLERMAEPVMDVPGAGVHAQVPRVMILSAVAA